MKCDFRVLSTGKPWVAPYTHPFFEVAHSALEDRLRKKSRFYSRRRLDSHSLPMMYDTFQGTVRIDGIWTTR